MKRLKRVLTFWMLSVIIEPRKAKGDTPKRFWKAEIADKKARRRPMY